MRRVFILDTVDSTNTWAKKHASLAPFCVVSRAQTAGRGQYGRTWHSPPCVNLYLTWAEPCRFPLSSYIYPTALALCSLLCKHKICARIKWPNDIYVEEKKIAGILIENAHNTAVIGVGLNVNMRDLSHIDKPTTSMLLLLNKTYELKSIEKELIQELEQHYTLLEQNAESLMKQWAHYSRKE